MSAGSGGKGGLRVKLLDKRARAETQQYGNGGIIFC